MVLWNIKRFKEILREYKDYQGFWGILKRFLRILGIWGTLKEFLRIQRDFKQYHRGFCVVLRVFKGLCVVLRAFKGL